MPLKGGLLESSLILTPWQIFRAISTKKSWGNMIRPSMKQDAFSWDDPCFMPVMAYPGLQATPVMQEKKMSKVQKSRVVHLWRSAASTMRGSPSNCQKVIRWKNPRGTFTQPWTFCCSSPWHFRSNDPKNGTFTAPAFCSFRYPPNCGAEHRQKKNKAQ